MRIGRPGKGDRASGSGRQCSLLTVVFIGDPHASCRPRSGPLSVSMDDESVTYAGSWPRMTWDTGCAIRHFGSGSPCVVSRP
jgi:hypothetical protein